MTLLQALHADALVRLDRVQFPQGRGWMHRNRLKSELVLAKFRPPMYPQLWGDFRYNVSALDLALNCGPKTRDILAAGA